MLKFLRKYQVFLLAIGGSLLMVVFLIQPVLQNFGFDPRSQKVATIGPAGRKVSQGELDDASRDLAVLRAVFSTSAGPQLADLITEGLLGLDPDNTSEHWLLLSRAAEDAGLVGVWRDGDLWIDRAAASVAQFVVYQQVLEQVNGNQQLAQLLLQQPQNQQQLAQLAQQLPEVFRQNRAALVSQQPVTEEFINRVLARAAAIRRLRQLHETAAGRLGSPGLYEQAKSRGAAALADYVLLSASLLTEQIPEPTDEQLARHFETYKQTRPGDTRANRYGVGYTLPPRLRLRYLVLDPAEIEPKVEVARLDVRRRWREQNPDAPAERFGDAEERVRRELRAERLNDATEVAERAVLAEFKRLLAPVREVDGYYALPDDWPEAGPDLEAVAARVERVLAQQLGIEGARPAVVEPEGPLTAQDLAGLDQIGRATFEVGSTSIPFGQLTQHVRPIVDRSPLGAQEGVPIFEPPATDLAQRRYYVVVSEARPISPPDSFEAIRDRVAEDWTLVRAFERLEAEAEEIEALARSSGLDALRTRFELPEDQTPREANLEPTRNARVAPGNITPPASEADESPVFDRRANAPRFADFRRAVIDAAELSFEPMADPAGNDPVTVVEPVPSLPDPVLAVALARAYRPLPLELYRLAARGVLGQAEAAQRLEGSDLPDPFAYEALTRRFEFVRVGDARGATPDRPSDPDGEPGAELDPQNGPENGLENGPEKDEETGEDPAAASSDPDPAG